ncbi:MULTISPECIES: DUF2087 domain-containing protein [Paenibacillus]|uniref:DUF2087 domain-containing protein n=1 Tax=Paenibacillus TaxID=44249 RepID=UPI0022B8CDBB|nr:metalloregulator ArsR/SmtB family transcription factor [Paenibacillus caseinilyticus]MCZ8520699.1 metalloregulator ArsR/SmtB family transcription factor [Paenibacillus caseinilyticus]
MPVQLDKIIAYHKALADPTRFRMLILLAQGECSGQQLAERLHLAPATVTHHAAKLREAALLRERREKNTIYFSVSEYFVRGHAQASLELIFKNPPPDKEESSVENEKLQASVFKHFFTKEGKLIRIPAQYKKKLIALGRIARELEKGRAYTERELNEVIKAYHEDFATIRREFIMHHFMFREKDVYELNPEEMWTQWEEVR